MLFFMVIILLVVYGSNYNLYGLFDMISGEGEN